MGVCSLHLWAFRHCISVFRNRIRIMQTNITSAYLIRILTKNKRTWLKLDQTWKKNLKESYLTRRKLRLHNVTLKIKI